MGQPVSTLVSPVGPTQIKRLPSLTVSRSSNNSQRVLPTGKDQVYLPLHALPYHLQQDQEGAEGTEGTERSLPITLRGRLTGKRPTSPLLAAAKLQVDNLL